MVSDPGLETGQDIGTQVVANDNRLLECACILFNAERIIHGLGFPT